MYILIFCYLWGWYIYNDGDAWDPNTVAAKVFMNAKHGVFTSVINMMMSFAVVGVLQANLARHNAAVERFNAFAGQCYDISLYLHTLYTSKGKEVSREDKNDFEQSIVLVSAIPNSVEHIFREDFDKEKVNISSSEKYMFGNHEDMGDYFLDLLQFLSKRLENLKDRNQRKPQEGITSEEWKQSVEKVATIYGPWGDMCTLRGYVKPAIIEHVLRISIFLWYMFTIPLIVDAYRSSYLLIITVTVLFIEGLFSVSNKIENPFISFTNNPYVMSKGETVSLTASATTKQIKRFLPSMNIAAKFSPLYVKYRD
jgi:hypothetical protein